VQEKHNKLIIIQTKGAFFELKVLMTTGKNTITIARDAKFKAKRFFVFL
jgi:hypothetical protein